MTNYVVQTGNCLNVSLVANGGTGYTWVLTALPAGLGLVDITTTVSSKLPLYGGPVTYTFTFAGIAKGKGKLAFELLRVWEPQDPADKQEDTVEITDSPADAAKSEAGRNTFAPLAYIACEGEHEGKVVLHSSANCTTKYGAPTGTGECRTLYGMPVMPYGFPPVTDYGIPPHHQIVPMYIVVTKPEKK